MAVLRPAAIAMILVAACYGPDAPDCTLACTMDSDCIGGQACSTDHFCATIGIASCAAHATTDGHAAAGSDAGMGSGSGSASYVMLTLHVDGNGSASTSTGDVCDSFAVQKDCMFQVVSGMTLTLTATPHLTKTFDKWMGMPCDNVMTAICNATPTSPLMIQAKFKN